MKKTMKNWLLMGLVTLAAGMFTACSSSDDGGSNIPIDTDGYVPVTLPNGLNNRALAGIVKDKDGKGISNVTVTTGSVTVKTNSAGLFVLEQVWVNGNRIVVNFSKDGYFDLTRSCDTYQTGTWDVSLIGKNEAGRSTSVNFEAAAPPTITIGETTVNFPADAFGAYAGTVNVDMAYLNPDDKDFADAMPGGDLQAVRVGGDEAELLSYGMIAVSITDQDGNPLNMQDENGAQVSFPIPASLQGGSAPETIPLWWFNDQTGKWEEDGEAKLVGDHYEGTVKHFSWWNLDYPYQQGTVEGHVYNSEGTPVPNITVHVGQRTTKTNSFGYYRQDVPAGEAFSVSVHSEDYGNYPGDAIANVEPLTPYEVRTVNLTLTKLYKVTGRLVQEGVGSLIGALSFSYGATTLPTVVTRYDGTFDAFIAANYSGPAKLEVTTAAGRKTIDFNVPAGADVSLGDIVFANSVITGGVITVTPSLAGYAPFNIPVPNDLRAYVDDKDNPTSISIEWQPEDWDTWQLEGGWNMIYINYDPQWSMFECIWSSPDFMTQFDSDRQMGTFNLIGIEGDKVKFSINGKCHVSFRGAEDEVWDEDAFYQSGELTATINDNPNGEDGVR